MKLYTIVIGGVDATSSDQEVEVPETMQIGDVILGATIIGGSAPGGSSQVDVSSAYSTPVYESTGNFRALVQHNVHDNRNLSGANVLLFVQSGNLKA